MATPTLWVSIWPLAFTFIVYAFYTYLVIPYLVGRKQVRARKPEWQLINENDVDPQYATHLARYADDLDSLGFTLIGTAACWVTAHRQYAFCSLWKNTLTRESAQVVGVRTQLANATALSVAGITLWSEFADGSSIRTSSLSSLSAFPRNPDNDVVAWVDAENTAVLAKLHRCRVTRKRGHRIATLETVQGVVERMEFEHTRDFQRLVRLGYYREDHQKNLYVPTIRGGFFMTWRLQSPLKQIQSARRKARLRRELRDCGLAVRH